MKKLVIVTILTCLPFLNGCIAFYTYEKYQVKVVDAESNATIGDAQINILYMTMAPILNRPKRINVTTHLDGSSAFPVADFAPSGWRRLRNIFSVNFLFV